MPDQILKIQGKINEIAPLTLKIKMLIHKRNCLTLVPVGGLGNRLLALFSAVHLISIGAFDSLRVLWEVCQECNIAFEDIGTINIPHEMIIHDKPPRNREILNQLFPYLDGQIITTCTNFSCSTPWLGCAQKHIGGIHQRFAECICPRCSFEFNNANLFQFAEKHYQKANTIDVSGHIGIHCRRTDWPHNGEIEEGYMKFTASDNKMINYANSITDKLFIATDSPYTLAHLRTAVGNRLIHYPKHHYPIYSGEMMAGWKPIERSANCVSDAIIDIILLSRCTQIVADSTSTFPTISGILGNININII